ncbi:MAG: 4-hydroxy-tetrahydrodipicolinate reductase [Chitinispirillia bacterium]|nr:4-hydroxy-tetrahydrodipicolinate reductase [Chitinispirillia bacterium]MCL2241436.1 4-hydroxy-tetrahydrodipicolinate reductase [Chitinispirillia bacterium]
MSTDIILVGALGRMGIEIARVIAEDKDVRLAGCVEYPEHFNMGQDYGVCVGMDFGGVKVSPSIEETGVKNAAVIDFSSVQSTRSNLLKAASLKMPMVVCTTGLEKDDYDLAAKAASSVPIIVSSNMSLGVNLLFSLTEMVAQKLGGMFDIEIIEAHHRFKKDSPSGTARTLGEIAAGALGRTYDKAVVNGRSGMITGTVRPPLEIGMHAVRGGDITGDHTVMFAGLGERLELRHMAHNRGIFARGSVVAAKWIAGRPAGQYTMKDVLGL